MSAGVVAAHYVDAAPSASYSSVVLADAPEVFLTLDQTSGNWLDASGNARDFTAGTGVVRNLTGVVNDGGKAASGSGSADIGTRAATLPTSLSTGTTQTLEAWITMPSGNVRGGIVKIGTNGNGWAMGIGAGRSDQLGRILVFARNGVNWYSTGYTLGDGRRHLVVVRNGSQYTSFVDAVQVNTQTQGAPNAPGNEIRIGNEEGPATTTYLSSNVILDNVAIYGTALSLTRIQAHYNAGL